MKKTYTVYRFVEGEWYPWGTWENRNTANEVALGLQEEGQWVCVEENEV